eukprot:gene27198-2446_t
MGFIKNIKSIFKTSSAGNSGSPGYEPSSLSSQEVLAPNQASRLSLGPEIAEVSAITRSSAPCSGRADPGIKRHLAEESYTQLSDPNECGERSYNRQPVFLPINHRKPLISTSNSTATNSRLSIMSDMSSSSRKSIPSSLYLSSVGGSISASPAVIRSTLDTNAVRRQELQSPMSSSDVPIMESARLPRRQSSVPHMNPNISDGRSGSVDLTLASMTERSLVAILKSAHMAEISVRTHGPPEKGMSLKSLLYLDQYDFVRDVDVSHARISASTYSSMGTADDFRQVLMSNAEPTRTSMPSPTTNVELSSIASNMGAILSEVTIIPDPTREEEDFMCKPEKYMNYYEEYMESQIASAQRDSNVLAVSSHLPPAMRRTRWDLEDYRLTKKLHKGYASRAVFKVTQEVVVLKVYKLKEQCDLQRMQLYREIRLHSRMHNHNIVQFYAAFMQDNDRVVLVQEYCEGGDLLKVIQRSGGRLLERQAVHLVLQPFLTGMLHLHSQGIVHRDIKPENVLFTKDRTLKICDFGLAIDLYEERANTRAGTLDYMAPEVLRCPTKKTPDENKAVRGSAHYHVGVDAWATGAFAYELITGDAPFKASEMLQTARNIMHAQVQFPASVSEQAKDFITWALTKHPGDRPTDCEMLRHPWITMFQRRGSVANPAICDEGLSHRVSPHAIGLAPPCYPARASSYSATYGQAPLNFAAHRQAPNLATHGQAPPNFAAHGQAPNLATHGQAPSNFAAHRQAPNLAAHGQAPSNFAAHGQAPNLAAHGQAPSNFAAHGQAPSNFAAHGQAPSNFAAHGQAPNLAAHGQAPSNFAAHGQAPNLAAHGQAPSNFAAHGQAPNLAAHGQATLNFAAHDQAPNIIAHGQATVNFASRSQASPIIRNYTYYQAPTNNDASDQASPKYAAHAPTGLSAQKPRSLQMQI